MRILLFTVDFPPILGGISAYSYGIVNGLSQLGEEVIVLTQNVRGDFEFDRCQKFKIIRVTNLILLREVLFFFSFLYIVKKYKIEQVFNVVWLPCGVISLLASAILNFSYYVAAHGSEIFDANTFLKRKIKKKLKWLMRLTFKNAAKSFPVSNFTKMILEENKIEPENLLVIPCGVDLNKFSADVDYLKITEKYGLADKRVILTVARLDEHKGHDLVIKSLPKVLEKIPNLLYLIVGGGPEKQRLGKLIGDLGLQEKVIFTGCVPCEDIPKYYRLCDVFVMPSRETKIRRHWFEGFGIVYLEANACGKPVIGGASGGISDVIIHGQTGLLVNPNDIKEISNAIQLLLTDEKYAALLGQRGRERAGRDFSWRKIARKIRAVMEQRG